MNALHSTNGPLLLGFTRGRKNIPHTTSAASCINPMALIVHANPALGNSSLAMPGKINPPVALPDATIPMAKFLLLLKYVDTIDMVGQKRHPFARPMHTPCARNNCQ